ncbi:phosphomannomutase/phosphoglucomutase [Halalkaliarchaeum desulfuricum]|uniref:Phosphomannomutase/phosphoglucomutase n=1 Tax=Halalkaliarchaeum desulfuricum TaxID=2055893 RepID=A0A343TKF4_9EURY|nr:phosphoglucosamine mutase [Halalkaliarchaeum desulfuricum]AUX09576.1 phosphomannomutase/phosphoglucomutase [Halalkaliarchaeum desulfuricum]
MELFGSSGTRGVALSDLTPSLVLRIAQAAGSEWGTERVAVARDTRTTGELFENAAAAGLASVGRNVDRLGVAPTPAVCRYCRREKTPAVLLTASHNPPEFNGVKLVGADGVELSIDALEGVEERILTESFSAAEWDEAGETRDVDGVNRTYVAELLEAVDRDAIDDADLTVALDPAHGAGALTSPTFFRRLGCEVVTVNGQPDGHFPGRLPEPVPEHLDDLRRLVRAADADVGIAHDGDADRAIFVDENGEYVEGDASFAALAAATLEPGDATVSAVNVSQRLVDVCNEVGADLELTPIGATNIITRVRELWGIADGSETDSQLQDGEERRRVPIAGEGNGGLFFPEDALVRDGALIGARFLELLAREETTVSELVAPYREYVNVRYNLEYDNSEEREAMIDAAAEYVRTADAEPDTTDGYRLDYGDAWVLVRPSGTEPKIRIYAEARGSDRAHKLADELYETLERAREGTDPAT